MANYKKVNSSEVLQNVKQEKLEQIKEVLPHLVNGDGNLDIDALKDFLGSENILPSGQGYSLNFAGKGLAQIKAGEPTKKELKLETWQSKNPDETENAIIRGDNLEVLKILFQNYYGKIKMIYIDPPYNTNTDNFVYCDSFRESEAELIEKYGLDEDKIHFFENMLGTKNHSGWLCFMYPRLKLAHELLADDGAIFISIDDKEQANLKLLCDEIFGENNFAANFIWQDKYTTTNDKQGVSSQTDYILCYSKNMIEFSSNKFPLRQEYIDKNYKNHDNDPNGRYMTVQMYKKKGKYSYEIESPSGEKWNKPWNFSKESMKKLIDNGQVHWGRDGKSCPRKKVYLKDSEGVNPVNLILLGKEVGFSQDGGGAIEELFDDRNVFLFPKPPSLIEHLLKIATNKDSIILDFFAGSGTTAQAVMKLNEEDEGKRKFILVQWDEEIAENTPPHQFCMEKDLKPIISSICIERVNRAGEKVITDESVDIGYKVFSLIDRPKIMTGEVDEQNHFNTNRLTVKDSLYNMIMASGEALLSDSIETIEKGKLYKVNDSYYMLGKCDTDLKDKKFSKVFVDGYADIKLEDWLNTLGLGEDKVEILY